MEKKTQGQRRTLPKPVKKLFWAGRLALGAAAFVPIFLFMVLFNFKVDCQGYFQGDQELRDVVELMLSGHDVVGAERLNNSQRKIIKTFVHNMEDVPATIALGSSRVMMISSEMLKTDSFYNCAITGADMYDLMGTYYLFEQRGAVPQNIIIGVDPWVFGGEDAVDPRSDKALYAEFLLRDLGIETDFETEDPTMKWEALYSPSYFQGNLTYFLSARGEVWSRLNQGDTTVVVDVSGITEPGEQSVAITSRNINFPRSITIIDSIDVRYTSPSTIDFTVSRWSSKEIPVQGTFNGSVAEGFQRRDFSFAPDTITVSGQEELVSQVDHAQITISQEDMNSTYSADCSYTLIGTNGQPIAAGLVETEPETLSPEP